MKIPSLTRRQIIKLMSAAAIPLPAAAYAATPVFRAAPGTSAPPPNDKSITLGLANPTYYIGFSPFLNWWKTAQEPTISRIAGGDLSGKAVWDAGIYLSPATGEIVSPAPADLLAIKSVFFAPPNDFQVNAGCDYSGEPWVVEWDGSASGRIDLLTSGGTQSNVGTNKITFTMGKNPGNTQLTLTLKNRNDPPRNIRIYQQRYAVNVAAGEKFNPDWLAVIKKFGFLRFMDWQYINNSEVKDFAQLADENYYRWCTALTSKSGFGPKGGIHPSLICQVANLTGCKVHVCFPAKCTDAFVSAFTTYMRNNTKVEVTYEFSNECWHFGFQQASYCLEQGNAIWLNDGARFNKWYGYRAAQVMQIVRSIYNDPSRWRGCINTQTVSIGPLQQQLVGINYLLSKTAPSLRVSDLFKGVYATGYFGYFEQSKPISSITSTNPAVVFSKGHGYTNGQRLKLFVNGMIQLNNKIVTVSNASADRYELSGVDATEYAAFATGNGNNYSVKSLIFEIMDKSNAKFVADPRTYPTKYTYFNQQLAQSLLTGNCSEGFISPINVANLRSTYWPALKTLATANGLDLRQYESGAHFVGDVYLTGFGGQAQFTEYLVNSGHSPEVGAVYAAGYAAFIAVGGIHPAKYTEGGASSRYGTWAGIRFWPTVANGNKVDTANPVWKATVDFNGSA
ncbi:hypothetical protein V1277_004706 [Bradyrhizobium sp. AZCC 1588]|uniref:hypothetical protein n=1 Tax=unclassified Bradyrhizobium TaxID=2631580 RepID=UPI002FF2EC80